MSRSETKWLSVGRVDGTKVINDDEGNIHNNIKMCEYQTPARSGVVDYKIYILCGFLYYLFEIRLIAFFRLCYDLFVSSLFFEWLLGIIFGYVKVSFYCE